jgi:hypothetical protein
MKCRSASFAERARPFHARTAMRTNPSRIFFACGIGLAVFGCGHPASVKECEEIVERIARLELEKANAGTETMANEIKVAKESFQKDMRQRCIGRRVTADAMNCVRTAKSSEQIEKECFR